MRKFCWLVVLFSIVAAAGACVAADMPVYTPSDTKVAIVPVLSVTGEKWGKLKESQVNCSYNEIEASFAERGFQVVDSKEVIKAISDLKIDLTDEEEQKRATIQKIGDAVGAHLVIFAIVLDSTQRTKTSVFTAQIEGSARVKMWLLDVKDSTPIISAKTFDAKRVSGSFGRGSKGSALQVDAARRAVETGLTDFMKNYKVVNKIEREDKPAPKLGGESEAKSE